MFVIVTDKLRVIGLLMDRERTQEKNKKPKIIVIALLFIVCVIALFASLDFSTARVERDILQIGSVKQGDFDIKVSATGVLLPQDVEWLAAQVEGRVARIHKRAGDKLTAGDVIVELTNVSVITAAEVAVSALEGVKAEMLSYTVELENELLNQKSVTLQAKFAYESAKLKLDAETELRKNSNIIADIDYRRTKLQVDQLYTGYQIELERQSKRKNNMKAQLAAKQAQVVQLSKSLDRANDNILALTINTGIDGVLQEMNLKIGQHLLPGSEIGRVARQDQLYAELKVIARQASNIGIGMPVIVDTRNGTINGQVTRIDPGVIDGTVLVDVKLIGDLPNGARPELQVEGVITIAQLRDVVFVGKPSYARENSKVSVYQLDDNSNYAERKVVEFGKSSVSFVEVVSGLKSGDKIILSDSSDWQAYEKILIN
jgi:HlyD family secretion protein